MWWTSLTGWERCCPAPSFPQGIPGASLLAQKFPGAPADPQPNRQGPSTRIARRKAWYTSCDLASCQGPRDCDLFYMFFLRFFHGKVCLMKWLKWLEIDQPADLGHVEYTSVWSQLFWRFWSFSDWTRIANWSFAALWAVGLPAQIPRNFQTTVAHWSLDFSHKFHQLTRNSPKFPHRMVELPRHFSMLLRRLNLRSETGQPLTTFRQPPPLPSSLDEVGISVFLVDVYFIV